jgi:hypothetical protein
MFGRPVPQEIIEKRGEPIRYWGARAIFHPGTKHPIDLLPDRQACKCIDGLASKPLLEWLNTKGMKELQKLRAFKALSSDSAEVVEFKDGEFTIQGCPNGSYGYLYLGAWQFWPDGCKYEQKEADPTAKWSSDKFPVPAIGSKVKASINGPWQGVVTGYFVEHGFQGIEVDCSNGQWPDFYTTKNGGDPKRVLFFGVDLTAVDSVCPKS